MATRYIPDDLIISELLGQEERRQQETINLIASENYASNEVRLALASRATDKYAEGYPRKRYYAGCEVIDQIEQIAIDRCKTLFQAAAANVQPHAGSQANFAAYFALLSPGDTILAMDLASGGHLTHGHPVNASGIIYRSIFYGVDAHTGCIDYDAVEKLADTCRPKLIVAGASAYARIIDFARFAAIAKAVGAYLMVDIAHIAGLVAAGVHPSPVPYADIVTSTTHKTLRGPRGGLILMKAELAERVNRAIMPGTQGGPFMNAIAAKAICFYEAMQPAFVSYQQRVVAHARSMAESFKAYGYQVLAGGTDTHLFVLDLRSTRHTGLSAQRLLAEVGIITSRSCVPNDPQSPWVTSGLRIGTPAMTTRGMMQDQADAIVAIIHELLHMQGTVPVEKFTARVSCIARALPLPL